MSNKPKIRSYKTLQRLAMCLRGDLSDPNFILLYAYNRTGKTRLSMEFKERGKAKNNGKADTLYFNAYTEDLFTWENDLENDTARHLKLKAGSDFFNGLTDLALDKTIARYLSNYANFDFDIDYNNWTVRFRVGDEESIKISRGEENIFIWCLFMAICERVLDGHTSYDWVKYIYIDDPISSLDDNNAILVGCDLAKLVKRAGTLTDNNGGAAPIKVVFSSHHSLFFNVVSKELKGQKLKRYFLYRSESDGIYSLRTAENAPFFHHVASLVELQKAADSGKLFTYHFNGLRTIFEKTSAFFGHPDISFCIRDAGYDDAYYNRAVNLLSHGAYSVYEPAEMGADNKELFKKILTDFLNRFQFELPEILNSKST